MAKDILKEAIADAKTVREVALANAKAALEEAFTPRLQSMLSAKLSEELDEAEDKEEIDEMYEDDPRADKEMDETTYMEGEKEDLDEEIDLEEILAELELEEAEDSKEETVDEAEKVAAAAGTSADKDKVEEAEGDDEKDTVDEAEDKEELDEQRPIYKAEYANDPSYKADHIHEDKEFNLDALLEEINNLEEDEVDDALPEPKDESVTGAAVGALAGIIIGGTPLFFAKAAWDLMSSEQHSKWAQRHTNYH